ncbi:hypothetical protein B0I35DRAFT_414525 [Stachybotrys elegans]|uniref:Uncharacterized protein n=1 Tax=Stachybotrys elegans TaxID=80388 RepID=A0A8K0WJG1_9HYPO|nr:hypothetical protein B0I35DRAFT_414525 [Stachybotrys elegans]
MSNEQRVRRQNSSTNWAVGSGFVSLSVRQSWSVSGTVSWATSTSTFSTRSTSTEASSSNLPGATPDRPRLNAPRSSSSQSSQSRSSKKKKHTGPTVEAPFEFGSADTAEFTVEECSEDESDRYKPIAVPQLQAHPTSSFANGYPRSLRSRGISRKTWSSFVETVAGFLQATVTEQAISHAVDVAGQISKRPKKLATNVASRTAAIGQEIGESAKQGNILGVATGFVKGAVSVPLDVVVSTTTAVLGLPITTALAASKKPATPRERATAYLAVANEEWLRPRKLFSGLLDSAELGNLVGVPLSSLPCVEEVDDEGEKTEEVQYSVLEGHTERLRTKEPAEKQLAAETLWLVVIQTA